MQEQKGESVYDLRRWINNLGDCELQNRNTKINGYTSRLENIEILPNNNNRYVAMRFMKLVDSYLPHMSYENKESIALELNEDEYLGKDVNCIYDANHYIIMIQNNRASLNITSLQTYINETSIKLGLINENQSIALKPIASCIDPRNLKRVQYRRFTVSFANYRRLFNGEKNDIEKLIDTFNQYESYTATIIFGLGHQWRNNSLDSDKVNHTIDYLYDNKELISSAKVEYSVGEKVEIFDLLDNIIYSSIIFHLEKKSSLGFDYAKTRMYEEYVNKLPLILNSLKVRSEIENEEKQQQNLEPSII